MSDPVLGLQLLTGRSAPLSSLRTGTTSVSPTQASDASSTESFKTVLNRERLKFSQHAEQRLTQRGIHLASDQLTRIANAVDQAAAKGAKDSLVLYKDIAMIVNVPSRTVVTAMDGSAMKEHIFTKIDSAVVVS